MWRCENALAWSGSQASRFHTAGGAWLFLIGAGLIVAGLVDGWRRFAVGGNGLLFGVQAWEGQIRDFMHLVVLASVSEKAALGASKGG